MIMSYSNLLVNCNLLIYNIYEEYGYSWMLVTLFVISNYLLPCIGCIITNLISIALAKLAIKSKIGRK